MDKLETPIVHFSVIDDFLKGIAENIVAENANDDRRIGFGKCIRRPFHELGEVK